MNNIVNGVIQVLDQLKNSGQLNSYLIDDDERKWTKLVYDIMINKFDMPFGNSTMQQASEIFNNAVRVWKGKNKLGNMMNMESKTMNKKLIRLTEQDLHRIVKESVQKMLVKNSENKTVKENIGVQQIGTPWSEYDEVMFRTAKKIIWESDDASDGSAYKVIDWLKSLKNRIQSKQNG